MFETDSTRKGILEARESFIRMVNVVFERTAIAVERPDSVAALDAETPVPDFLIWRQLPGERHVNTIPPASEYDEQVYTIEERDSLLMDPAFVASLATANRRVLVNGLSNDTPQWSVWLAIAPVGGVQPDTDPETVFTLARNYDFPAAGEEPLTRAQRNLLTQSLNEEGGLPPGSRVLMQGDAQTGGFWTIWEYSPNSASADDAGFVLRRCQTYRTADFWDHIDWYAEGYSVSNPPVVRYPNAAARNAVENPVPNTKFVRLDDDGNGRWVWTVFADGAWNIVAREKGTIRLSEKLYDPSREILFEPTAPAPSPEKLRRVFNREGSWELRILVDALRDHGAFTDLEINEVFFSMLHFVHSQQDQVSWAFKTSFLNIGGYNESLRPVPVQPVDNTQNLLDYIEEVKPYRVKTRDFTRVVTPDIDVANIHVTDFDLPPYYDETTGKYRILSIGNAVDLEIIKKQSPWKDWYENYQKTLREPEYYEATTFNPVRQLNIRMNFDRVDHMPMIAEEFFKYRTGNETHFDTHESVDNRLIEVFINHEKVASKYVAGAGNRVFLSVTPPDEADIRIVIRQGLSFLLAADRVQRFYNPVAAEKNIRALLGLEPKIGVLDGGDFTERDADYQVQIGSGYEKMNSDPFYGLSDPLHSGDRPEELVVVGASESLTIRVIVEDDQALSGPEMSVSYFDVPQTMTDDEVVIPVGPITPQSADAVIVWRDGMRAVPGDDYSVDMNAGTIRINVVANLEPTRTLVEKVKVRVFGPSTSTVNVQVFPAGTTNFVLANPTSNGTTAMTFVDAFDPATKSDFPLYGARRLTPDLDYTVSGSSLIITKPIDAAKKVIVTTFLGTELLGLSAPVYDANTSNSYPVSNVRGEAYLWSTLDGLDRERNDLQGDPDQVIEPEFNFEMKGVKHAVVGSNSYPVSISTDGSRAIFYNTNGRCDIMNAKTGALLRQYPRAKFNADFKSTHPNHGLYQAGWYSMDDLPGTNYVVVSLFYYDLGYLTAVMIYEIVGDELVFYGSRFVPTPICTEIMAAGFDSDGGICLTLLTTYEQPVLVKLPKLDPVNGDLWQANYWNGKQSTKDADTTVHVATNEQYCMTGFWTYGRTGGRDGGGFIVPTPTGPRWYFYVSSGRIAYNISTDNGRWDFAYNEGLTKPRGFMAYMDFNEPTPVARVLDSSAFDMNGPPFHDDKLQRDGTPDAPWTGVNGGQPRSSYTDQMQASPLVDGVYNSKFVVSFHKEYNGAVNAPQGMAIKAVLFYFDPNTGLFEYFKEVEGDTVDTVKQYGFPSYDRYDYRKVGPTVFWARDTGDVFELFGDYDNNLITAAQIGDFKPETVVIPNEQKVVFANFNPAAGISSESFVMSTARPGNDLMAPKETGDYDARPLNDISHDIGVVGGSNPGALILVNSVDMGAIRTALTPVIDPDLVIIRKVKDGRPLAEYLANSERKVLAGDVVIDNGNLFKARTDGVIGPVSNLINWSPYGVPTSIISVSEVYLLPAIMAALAPFSPTIKKEIADTPVFVQRSDAWEFTRFEAAKGKLQADLPVDASEIVIEVNGEMPFTPPTYQKVAKSKKKSKDKDALESGEGVKKIIEAPGVVWINGERIEFFEYSKGEGTVTLSELRRGTHGTQISMETRAINRASSMNPENPDQAYPRGDGVQKSFMLIGSFTDTNHLDVVLHGALKEPDGSVRVMDFYSGYDVFLPQRKDVDYTAKRESNGIRVTFMVAPEKNVEVIIGKTSDNIHKAGSEVRDGRSKFDIRPDQSIGGMVFY